jgi:hypothetical protein
MPHRKGDQQPIEGVVHHTVKVIEYVITFPHSVNIRDQTHITKAIRSVSFERYWFFRPDFYRVVGS